MKGRFIVNPFPELVLSPDDRAQLGDLANQCITTNLEFYTKFVSSSKRSVNPNRWKMIKEGEKLKVYSEKRSSLASTLSDELTGSGLPMLLCVGTMEGKLDDLMFGVISEDLETMRIKASYVDDVSGAAVLEGIVLPTAERPFQSLALKWMEVDIPFRSTGFIKNRDYVYLEGTGYVTNSQGERLGYHLVHSVSFPQTGELPNRVRGNISIIALWRQLGPNTMEMYATCLVDPGDTGMIRKLAVQAIADVFLSTLKYAYCGQMRKLAFMLDRKYAESKVHGAPNRARVCVTCSSPVHSRRMRDFGKSSSTCKLCFGFVCSVCKIVRKLSFVDPDLLLSQRKVTFCSACISNVTSMSAIDVARTQIATKHAIADRSSFLRGMSSEYSSVDASYSSQER
ncbi:hypothetical protein PF005_g23263 [Phytophthora fragariae]|uniref:FYVE-type domain-containing protein n=1 Tax=Phytophthora fragariae TaxID=53985 RepID=A0A6A3RPU3_9STRA|nr:hypothetical protein PF003_g13063 [Phytophthora fragariae]KAE8937255.1 hypothetical protein PF009_g12833 [Phytophthora fragariae]KAE8981540.1 hypothetical protein PF011_g21975 [Phytophthora fragariae]KAE9079692.1 hypothetical protein PF007_g23349 [Phytophthora fragariae]KAE9080513.1 hypothetical protein PF010_g22350 [Phytophthora fragariae]